MRAALACTLIALAGCASKSTTQNVQADPDAPGLRVDDQSPDVAMTNAQGDPVTLASLYTEQPLVLIFYRGGWCPFCRRALSEWESHLDDINAAGARLVAVTPESPDSYARTIRENDLDYTVLGDPDLSAAKAFNVYLQLDDQTRASLEQNAVDLTTRNAGGTWELPAPGTFIIDSDGVIRFAYASWDFTDRATPEDVVNALQELQEGT